jgi:hypothetical protein
MEQIRDGKGRGFLAAINKDNQLVTRATAVEQRLHSTVDGHYFEITTNKITLTTDNEIDIIYIKNLDTMELVIDRVFFDIWESNITNLSGSWVSRIL